MQFLRPVMEYLKSGKLAVHGPLFAFLTLSVLSYSTGHAFAAPPGQGGGSNGTSYEDFHDYASGAAQNLSVLPDIFAYVCYLIACVMGALAVNEMRKIVDGTGGGGLAWRHPLTKLGFGGIMLTLPYAVAAAQGTMNGGQSSDFGFIRMNAFKFQDLSTSDDSISGMISHGVYNAGVLVNVSAFAAFIIGVWFITRGIQMLKAHIDNPGNAPLPESMKRLAVGGALLSLPLIAKVVRNTLGVNEGGALAASGWNISSDGGAAGGGLDQMMVHFVQDVATPAYYAIEAFCFIAGVVMILFAMQRLVRSAQDGPRGPLGFGTIAMFFVAGALLSFPQLLQALDTSILGGGIAQTRVDAPFMSAAGGDAVQKQHAINVISAAIAFMAVVGFLSIVRGLFMIKTLAEGGQATLMQVVVHLVAGSMAINIGAVINAIQHSLGLSPSQFALVFS